MIRALSESIKRATKREMLSRLSINANRNAAESVWHYFLLVYNSIYESFLSKRSKKSVVTINKNLKLNRHRKSMCLLKVFTNCHICARFQSRRCSARKFRSTALIKTNLLVEMRAAAFALFVFASTLVDAAATVDWRRRVDCHPEPNATEEACEARGCEWSTEAGDANVKSSRRLWVRNFDLQSRANIPACFFSATTTSGYKVATANASTWQRNADAIDNPYGGADRQTAELLSVRVQPLGAGQRVTVGVEGRRRE